MKPFQCSGCKMITCSLLFASLIIAAIASLASLSPVSGQTTTEPPSLIVGTAGARPIIDGVWQVSEWDDAVEARLAVYWKQVNEKGEVYVRLKHDNSSLYVLIDSVSDSGLTWKEDSLNVTGWAMLWFDGNNNGYPLGDKNDFTLIISPWNKRKGNYVQFFRLNDGANFTAQASVADKLGASPHSSAGHRVYEFSVPMKLITGSTEGTQSKTIGFNISVQDSYQNVLTLSKLGVTLAKLQFTENVLPEHPEVLIPLLLTLTALILHKSKHYHAARQRQNVCQ